MAEATVLMSHFLFQISIQLPQTERSQEADKGMKQRGLQNMETRPWVWKRAHRLMANKGQQALATFLRNCISKEIVSPWLVEP